MADRVKLRNAINKRRPKFERQQVDMMKQFAGMWRKPVGIHSKMRRGFRGKGVMPAVGYRGPRDARGLSPAGMGLVIVNNAGQLADIDAKNQCAVIAGSVGTRKKTEIVKKAGEMKIIIFNIKDGAVFLEGVARNLLERKGKAKERLKRKEKSKEEAEKKAAEKEKEKNSEKEKGKEQEAKTPEEKKEEPRQEEKAAKTAKPAKPEAKKTETASPKKAEKKAAEGASK